MNYFYTIKNTVSLLEKLKKEQYYLIVGLIAGGYITIFYDISKYLIDKYVFASLPKAFDHTVGTYAVAGLISIAIGLLAVGLLLKGKFKKSPTD